MSKKENTTLKEATEKKFELESSMQKGNITQEALEPFPADYDFIPLLQKLKGIYKEVNHLHQTSTNNIPIRFIISINSFFVII